MNTISNILIRYTLENMNKILKMNYNKNSHLLKLNQNFKNRKIVNKSNKLNYRTLIKIKDY